ncbi:MAG: hypothetical protein QF689_16445 [Candidatus Latescibacteria bacterium]|nr:hypothetical protein [Candidatus Latescibacterota bacterium]MDP7450183.1 hypothetical protein [Candidatus Latescibacterota bacterium]HJP32110.1 hypothetical protein [Candidatus Latescibacterota bacterium]
MNEVDVVEQWLVGDVGVWQGRLGDDWRRLGPYPFPVHGLARSNDTLLVGTGYGLWAAPPDPAGRWVQLHDETLTEVLSVAATEDGAPVAAGSYGVAMSTPDELGLPRWRSLTEEFTPDERYTNVLCLAASDLWLAGTEAGLLGSTDGGDSWSMTQVNGSPVRSLISVDTVLWAGTDDKGLWRSEDGQAWTRVDCPTEAVFSIAVAGDFLLVGGYDGIYRRDAEGVWGRSGPRALIRCLVADGKTWAAGADPGGLWYSEDEGGSWQRTGPFLRVNAICGPMEGGGS